MQKLHRLARVSSRNVQNLHTAARELAPAGRAAQPGAMKPLRAPGLAALCLLVLPAGLAAGAAGAAEVPPAGSVISGHGVALDGDTLLLQDQAPDGRRVGGQKVRVWGVSAPEMGDWPYGAWSRGVLDQILGLLHTRGPLVCTVVGKSHDRAVARCAATDWAGSVLHDLGYRMIAAGAAVTYRIYSHGPGGDGGLALAYDLAEQEARYEGRGIWAGAWHAPNE